MLILFLKTKKPLTIKSVMVKQSHTCFKNKPKCLFFLFSIIECLIRNQFVCTFANCTEKMYYLRYADSKLFYFTVPLSHTPPPSPLLKVQCIILILAKSAHICTVYILSIPLCPYLVQLPRKSSHAAFTQCCLNYIS